MMSRLLHTVMITLTSIGVILLESGTPLIVVTVGQDRCKISESKTWHLEKVEMDCSMVKTTSVGILM